MVSLTHHISISVLIKLIQCLNQTYVAQDFIPNDNHLIFTFKQSTFNDDSLTLCTSFQYTPRSNIYTTLKLM